MKRLYYDHFLQNSVEKTSLVLVTEDDCVKKLFTEIQAGKFITLPSIQRNINKTHSNGKSWPELSYNLILKLVFNIMY